MKKTKKFNFRVVREDTSWSAEITRRVTSKKIHISKKQDGFTTESAAQEWGKKELENYLQGLSDRNSRHSKHDEQHVK